MVWAFVSVFSSLYIVDRFNGSFLDSLISTSITNQFFYPLKNRFFKVLADVVLFCMILIICCFILVIVL